MPSVTKSPLFERPLFDIDATRAHAMLIEGHEAKRKCQQLFRPRNCIFMVIKV